MLSCCPIINIPQFIVAHSSGVRLLPLTSVIACLYTLKHLASFPKAYNLPQQDMWRVNKKRSCRTRISFKHGHLCVFYNSMAKDNQKNSFVTKYNNYKPGSLNSTSLFHYVNYLGRQPYSLAMIFTSWYSRTSPLRSGETDAHI